jgi:hypothetical protein
MRITDMAGSNRETYIAGLSMLDRHGTAAFHSGPVSGRGTLSFQVATVS